MADGEIPYKIEVGAAVVLREADSREELPAANQRPDDAVSGVARTLVVLRDHPSLLARSCAALERISCALLLHPTRYCIPSSTVSSDALCVFYLRILSWSTVAHCPLARP